MTQAPSIGRIVHLQNGTQTVAAIITAVHEDGVSLTAFQPDCLPGYVRGHVPYADPPVPGHWSWPPRI
jgi:hypothetical protein